MVIYSKNEKYKIWANTEDKKFYVQLSGKEIRRDSHDNGALAIAWAEDNGS